MSIIRKFIFYILGFFGAINNLEEKDSFDVFIEKFRIYAFEQYGVDYKYHLADKNPQIVNIFISFDHHSTPSKQESILLPIKIKNDLLAQLNQSKKLAPFFRKHPLTSDAVSIEVMYQRIDKMDIYSTTCQGNDIKIYYGVGNEATRELYKNYLDLDGKPLDECEKVVEILK